MSTIEKHDMTQGKILLPLVSFTIPLVLGNLFQLTYNAADSVIVGKYVGEQALAAVGTSTPIMNIAILLISGMCMGASVLMSSQYGAKDYDTLSRQISTTMLAGCGFSVVFSLLMLLLANPVLRLIRVPETAIPEAAAYLRIIFMGLIFTFMYNFLANTMRALGDSKTPLYFLIGSSLGNIFLDYWFVAGLHWGVAGVAWATFIAQGISAVCSFLIFLRSLRRLDGKAETWFSKAEFSSMSRIALPSILQQSTVSIGMMLVQSVVNGFGTQILAGFSAGMRIESLCVVPMAAIGNALSSYTAQNIGAEKHERISLGYRTANIMVAITAVILCLFLELLHRPLIALFLDGAPSAQTVATGEGYLRFIGFFFCMIGFKMAVDGILRGAGAVKVFTIANLVNLGLRVLIAKLGAPVYGIAMIWYAVPLGWLANFLISYGYYRTGKWKQLK